MSLIASRLPQPTNVVHDIPNDAATASGELNRMLLGAKEHKEPPPYGRRSGFIPRSVEDFGEGGAFPEIHVAQYPLSMGRKKGPTMGATVPVQVGADGKIRRDLMLRVGQREDKVIHSTVEAARAKDIVSASEDPSLQMPDVEEIERQRLATEAAISKLVQGKLAASQPKAAAAPQEIKSQVVRYKPASQSDNDNSGAKDRIVRIVDQVKDPLEMAKFKHVKVPRGPGSPPPPVMHSPPKKVTHEEQQAMRIPPCISSWKNPKGYTVPIDKRLAASGKGLQDNQINDKFSKFSGALQVAIRNAQETKQMQIEIQKLTAQKEKEAQEEKMRRDAQQARDERAGFRPQPEQDEAGADNGEDLAERDTIREERRKEREREMRLSRAGGNKKNQLRRERERDISEKIALGMNMGAGKSDSQFDTRLYNQTQGMGSGFGADDAYDVYDKALFRRKDEQGIYKPSAQISEFDDAEKLKKGLGKFQADKSFSGAADASAPSGSRRDGPVQFEKQQQDDVFGLEKILSKDEGSSKRSSDDRSNERDSKRRR